METKKVRKVQFKHLSKWLQVAIIGGYVSLIINGIYFAWGFLLGLLYY